MHKKNRSGLRVASGLLLFILTVFASLGFSIYRQQSTLAAKVGVPTGAGYFETIANGPDAGQSVVSTRRAVSSPVTPKKQVNEISPPAKISPTTIVTSTPTIKKQTVKNIDLPKIAPKKIEEAQKKTTSVSNARVWKTAIILANFSDNVNAPFTVDEVKKKAFSAPDSANEYFKEVSGGRVRLAGYLNSSDGEGDIFGWYTLSTEAPDDCGTFGPSRSEKWDALAMQQAADNGFVPEKYNSIIFVYSLKEECGSFGNAGVGGNKIHMHGPKFDTGILIHEIGHNMGLNHANAYECKDDAGRRLAIAVEKNCHTLEYRDGFDVMGDDNGRFLFSSFNLGFLNFLGSGNYKTVKTDGVYSLSPLTSKNGVRMIQIPIGLSGGANKYYYLEYRQPVGLDGLLKFNDPTHPGNAVYRGVSIRLAPDFHDGGLTHLIDTTPETNTFSDAALVAGRTFVDPINGISILTIETNSSAATVQINFTSSTKK